MTAVRRQVEAGRGLAKSGASRHRGTDAQRHPGGTIARNKERADREKATTEENSPARAGDAMRRRS